MARDQLRAYRLSRRGALRLIGAGASVAVLSACAAAVPSAGTQAAAPAQANTPQSGAVSQAATPTPRSVGTLRWGILGDIVTIDQPIPTNQHLARIMDPLVTLDEKLNMVPMLAESWDWSPDATRIQFNLRKGVRWHTGREFTSADVKWNFEHFRDPKVGNGIPATSTARVTSVETPDPYTVVINSKPFNWMPTSVALLDMTDPETNQGPDGKTKAVGTGPFIWGERVQGDHFTIVKNPNYWGNKAYLDQITFQIFSDPQAMVSQLEGGAIDVADMPPLKDATRLQKDSSYQVLFNNNGGGLYVVGTTGTRDPIGTNKQLRQALAFAIDRQRIVDTALFGVGKVQELPWYPTSPAYDSSKNNAHAFDLDRARSLLQAAGLPNVSLEFTYSAASPEIAAMAQIYQADLAKVGVTLNLKPVDPVALVQAEINHTSDLIGASNSLSHVQPGIEGSSPWYGPPPSWTGYDTPELHATAESIQAEPDPAKLKQATDKWNDYLLDQCTVIGIATIVPRAAMSSRVHGMYYDMATSLNASGAWLS